MGSECGLGPFASVAAASAASRRVTLIFQFHRGLTQDLPRDACYEIDCVPMGGVESGKRCVAFELRWREVALVFLKSYEFAERCIK